MTDSGILLYYKKAGQTSFRSLNPIKHAFSVKTGHAGTLDKFAEGLLIVLLGKYTRLNTIFSNMDKEYEAVFRFGCETDTLDPEGTILRKAEIPSLKEIENKIHLFNGDITQVPPVYSAIHVNGKRAYSEARKGRPPEMPERKIKIHDFSILRWDSPDLTVRIHCSKGTYIRSLARDLGTACGSAAYTAGLRRTAIGPFSSGEAYSGEPDTLSWKNVLPDAKVFSRISSFYSMQLTQMQVVNLKNGIIPDISIPAVEGRMNIAENSPRFAALLNSSGEAESIVRLKQMEDTYIPEKIVVNNGQ